MYVHMHRLVLLSALLREASLQWLILPLITGQSAEIVECLVLNGTSVPAPKSAQGSGNTVEGVERMYELSVGTWQDTLHSGTHSSCGFLQIKTVHPSWVGEGVH